MKTPSTIKDTQIHYGVSWYPEMWPETEWPKDIAKMREVGFTLVRLFEFAWKRFEPAEGQFETDWARKLLDQLHEAGIQAMIGTPTAAPPAWLTSAYPEVLGTLPDGRRKEHGKRKHYNHHSRCYREKAERILREMVSALGDHPAVHSWQIDNEMAGYDYGPETRQAFHAWLKTQYGTIENLNATWGLDFWSQAYDAFDQIPMVTAQLGSRAAPERHHPSLLMAQARFQNQAWTDFIAMQALLIRNSCNLPVTTNMTGAIGGMDWFRHFRVLDRSGASMYSDLNYYHLNFMRFDRLRAEKPDPYWLLETAPNWSGGGPVWNIHHDERGIRAFTWLSILMGGSMVLYWQWRSHWAGQEMQHGTCVSQTGQWMPGKATWQRVAREFKTCSDFLIEHPAATGPVAILVDSESSWVSSIDPIHESNQYVERIREDYQLPLQRAHYHRDLIHPEADFNPYRLLVVPHMPIIHPQTRDRLENWVREGGALILGPLSGYRSTENTLHREQAYGGLESLIGAEQALRFSPHWVEDTISVVFENGLACHPRIWCDAFDPATGTTVLARYQGGYGDGLPAVVHTSFGAGTVTTLGCPLSTEAFLELFQSLAKSMDIEPMASGSPQVVVSPRVDPSGRTVAYGLVNTSKSTASVHLNAEGTDLLSSTKKGPDMTLEPLEVLLVRL